MRPLRDGVAGGLLALWALSLAGCDPAAAPEPPPPNLLIVSWDTVRRDHLPVYGYDRPTAPFLSELAADGAVFDRAFTQDTNTSPAHASLFTGLYPHEHGNQVNGNLLAEERVTLAEILSGAGYQTAAFLGGAPMKRDASGLQQGFATYDDEFADRRRDGRLSLDRALAWLEGRDPERPFFLFAHFWDAHGPYEPDPEELLAFDSGELGPALERIPKYQQLTVGGAPLTHLQPYVDRYDALIHRVDDLTRRLVAAMPDDTVVVVLADHGESFDERYHQLDHGAQVVDEQIRIPLVIAGPGVAPGRVDRVVEMVDLLPTVLDLVGVERQGEVSGRSVAGLVGGGASGSEESVEWDDTVFAAARADSARVRDRGYRLVRLRRVWGVRSPQWKLVVYPAQRGDVYELFDLRADPGETENVFLSHKRQARNLLDRLEEWHPRHGESIDTIAVSDELRRQLRSLGYLD